jgi:hypothetical protein
MESARRPLAKVINLATRDAEALHRELLELAEAARRGEITGIAYTALTRSGSTRQGLLGRARKDIPRALVGVQRLARVLLDMAP